MGLRSRIRRRLRGGAEPAPADPSRTELSTHRLADGTVLERCVVATLDQVRAAVTGGERDRLVFHYRATDGSSAHDLHHLRELHLFYSGQLDLVSVAWDLEPGVTGAAALRQAGLSVDAFHRDHGLTWQSLLYDGAGGSLEVALGCSGALPQVLLLRADGQVVFHRVGAWQDKDRQALELAISARA